ncbi:LIM-domain-containing protein [Sistotremastrum niveocremeum HHB9708]|uniref:LIM-domain-containing protein n=1 Tax=Sistotremastrum niveocremeum HHB9708 TaxID=1314777 RepID=A0A164Q7Z6_9AGAM|nr:LIM-domain-containing protein [Sistotremastrum niveocremeum HHB9708]
MHPFGGTPICPRCNKAVYAAEQVMGPARKPCLTCTTCNTRLDSLKLQEHDQERISKSCHVKNFATVDLRHANLPTSTMFPGQELSSSEFKPSAGTIDSDDSSSLPSLASHDDKSDIQIASNAPTCYSRESSPTPVEMYRSTSPIRATAPWKRATSPVRSSFTGSTPSFSRPSPPRSSHVSPAPSRSNSMVSPTPMALLSPMTTGSVSASDIARRLNAAALGSTPTCPRCNKAVYFAEQAKASNRTWHKSCLRCSECSTPLDSSKLTEKDGVLMCRNCYSKHHGPQGSGYALIGRSG